MASVVFYILIYLALYFEVSSPKFFLAFKALSYIIQIGFYSCFWTFSDQYFELQNAKQFFGIFYSAIFLGTAVAGGVMTLPFISLNSWMILAITTIPLLTSAFLIKYMNRSLNRLPDDYQEFAVLRTTTRDIFQSIITSPFTILLLLFCILLQILLLITEYEFMFGLQNYFNGGHGNELTQFLGKLYLFGSLFNIIFGVFIYGRIIKKAGLNNVLLIVPLFFSALFFGWSFSSHLILTIMGFIAVEGVLTLVEDNNFTLLLNAVPLKLKNKIRIVTESLVEPCGVFISSILILICKHHGKMLGLCFSIVFVAIGLLLRAYYTKGILYNLIAHVINFQPQKHSWETSITRKDYQKSKDKFVHQFSNLKENEQFFIIECALRFNDLKLLNTLFAKITKLSMAMKLNVIHILDDYSKDISSQFLPFFSLWVKQHPALLKHLTFHLAKMNLIESISLKPDEIFLCPYIKASKALIEFGQTGQSDEAQNCILELLLSEDEIENQVAIEAIRFIPNGLYNSILIEHLTTKLHLKESILKTLSITLSIANSQALPIFLQELDHENQIDIRYLLISCIEKIMDLSNLKEIISHTDQWKSPERRDLVRIIAKMSADTTPILLEILEDPAYSDKVRLLAGQVLSLKDKKLLKLTFQKVFSNGIQQAYLYYYHFLTIQKEYPSFNLSLLEQALKHSYESIIDFIIQIQACIQNIDKGDYIAQSLHSTNPKTNSHALETLQKMCPNILYKRIQPLVEKGHEKGFFKLYQQEQLPILSLEKLLVLLEQSPSYVNRMIVFSLKNRLNKKAPQVQANQDSLDKEPKLEVILQ